MYPLLVNPRGYRRAYPPGTRPTRLARADVARLQALGSFLEAESREVSLFDVRVNQRIEVIHPIKHRKRQPPLDQFPGVQVLAVGPVKAVLMPDHRVRTSALPVVGAHRESPSGLICRSVGSSDCLSVN